MKDNFLTNQVKAVFLDRDGTLIVDHAYLDNVEGVELLSGAETALLRLAAAGFLLVLITNQSGVGRGYFSLDTVDMQHARLAELLSVHGLRLAAVEVCPHAPDTACSCRKPSPQMLQRAATRLDINLQASFMIGDKESDVAAGHAAGCRSVILGAAVCEPSADFRADNLEQAVDWILNHA